MFSLGYPFLQGNWDLTCSEERSQTLIHGVQKEILYLHLKSCDSGVVVRLRGRVLNLAIFDCRAGRKGEDTGQEAMNLPFQAWLLWVE